MIIPGRHFVLRADPATLRNRMRRDRVLGPSAFRLEYLEAYAKAAQDWLHDAAEVLDTRHITPAEAAGSS